MSEVREPIKKTSIAKKERIIKKGFELMCNKGYHNVSCVDIAKYANVSTGIIYQYFNDKRDIFIEGTKDYADKIMFPMLGIIDNKDVDKKNIREKVHLLIGIIDNYCHEVVYHKHKDLNYDVMKDELLDIIVNFLD